MYASSHRDWVRSLFDIRNVGKFLFCPNDQDGSENLDKTWLYETKSAEASSKQKSLDTDPKKNVDQLKKKNG